MAEASVTASTKLEAGRASFVETPYMDATWEIVGQVRSSEEFAPLEVQTMTMAERTSDPMFESWDAAGEKKVEGKRWHLPKGLAYRSQEEIKREQADQANRISLKEEELAILVQQALDKGRAEGLEQAGVVHNQKMKALEERIQQLMKDLQAQVGERWGALEKDAVELSLAVSRKIITFAVEISPEYITELVREALSHVGNATIRKVRVSPEDMEFVEVIGISKQLPQFDGTWTFEADASIRAGCVVETSAGEVDYQLDEAWERLKEKVVKVIR